MHFSSLAVALLAVPTGAISNTGVFVHLFEWSHADVAQECEDFLGPKVEILSLSIFLFVKKGSMNRPSPQICAT